jgi:hypothetical protein
MQDARQPRSFGKAAPLLKSYGLGLAAFAALGLAAAQPAHAQDGYDATSGTPVTFSSGTYTGATIGPYGADGLYAYETPVTVNGGSFSGGPGFFSGGSGVFADSGSVVTLNGGSFNGGGSFFVGGDAVDAENGGQVNINGGSFTNGGTVIGYPGDDLYSTGTGSGITVYGTGFTYDDSVAGTGSGDATFTGSDGTFTGTLANGGTETFDYAEDTGGTITLAAPLAVAPEPSAFATVGLVALFAGGLMLKARKRSGIPIA